MASVLFDIPKLSAKIAEITPSYVQQSNNQDVDLPIGITTLIRGLMIQNLVKSEDYWKTGDIRMMDPAVFNKCMSELKENSITLGEGFYGKVYDVPVRGCFLKNLPSTTKRIGVKVENIKYDYSENQTPTSLRRVIEITKKASELEIGPALYDVFVSVSSSGVVQIIKIFEIIDGSTWEQTEWKSDVYKKDALAELDKLVHTMNSAGIIHHDLHPGNVMVRKDGKVFIIDYDNAKWVSNEEESNLKSFNSSYPSGSDPKGVLSTDGVKFVYNKLVQDGSIVTSNKNGGKRVSRKRVSRKKIK